MASFVEFNYFFSGAGSEDFGGACFQVDFQKRTVLHAEQSLDWGEDIKASLHLVATPPDEAFEELQGILAEIPPSPPTECVRPVLCSSGCSVDVDIVVNHTTKYNLADYPAGLYESIQKWRRTYCKRK